MVMQKEPLDVLEILARDISDPFRDFYDEIIEGVKGGKYCVEFAGVPGQFYSIVRIDDPNSKGPWEISKHELAVIYARNFLGSEPDDTRCGYFPIVRYGAGGGNAYEVAWYGCAGSLVIVAKMGDGEYSVRVKNKKYSIEGKGSEKPEEHGKAGRGAFL